MGFKNAVNHVRFQATFVRGETGGGLQAVAKGLSVDKVMEWLLQKPGVTCSMRISIIAPCVVYTPSNFKDCC